MMSFTALVEMSVRDRREMGKAQLSGVQGNMFMEADATDTGQGSDRRYNRGITADPEVLADGTTNDMKVVRTRMTRFRTNSRRDCDAFEKSSRLWEENLGERRVSLDSNRCF